MAGRSDARRAVLQMLYLIDQNPEAEIHWIRENLEQELKDDQLLDFAWSLFIGVREHRSELDQQISDVASNWRVDRMAPTDRNVLRLGCFELHSIGTPVAVALNECIELAREFGAEGSASFVNGILDKLADGLPSASEATGPAS